MPLQSGEKPFLGEGGGGGGGDLSGFSDFKLAKNPGVKDLVSNKGSSLASSI
jgi:hypothetical protein